MYCQNANMQKHFPFPETVKVIIATMIFDFCNALSLDLLTNILSPLNSPLSSVILGVNDNYKMLLIECTELIQ